MNRLRDRLFGIILAFSLVGPPALAGTHVVTTGSAKDFLAGDALGTGISADGRLSLSLAFAARAWPEDAADAVVFAASADGSGRVYIATGGGLGRLFATGADGKVSLLFTAPEPNVTAVAVASDGTVVCGTSPNGKLYRVDPREKSGKEIGDPKEAAIWALAFGPDGTLYVGTGNKGRIYRRTPAGTLELFFTAEDTHVRCLTTGKDGTVYAGTSEKGLVLAVSRAGTARTLHDFTKPEVVSLVVLPDGALFAAATSAEPPPVVPAPAEPKLRAPATPTPAAGSREEVPRGTVSVSVTTGPIRLPSAREAREGSGEIVQISPDGFVEPAWTFPEETIYSMRLESRTGELLIGTGPRGRVYAWKDRHLRLLGQTEQKQVVAALPGPSGAIAVTMNTPGVFAPAKATPAKGVYVSAAKDAGRLARFGRLRFEGTVPPGASVSFSARAGNAEKPDGSWTPWSTLAADGATSLPYARFFQWRAELVASPKGESPILEKVDFSYVERNARPVLENVAILEPGAVYSSRGGGSSSAVLSVTNPDENGIYAGLESPRDGPEPPLGKRLYRKGYRTATWKGADPNGDSLRYDLDARREGESVWFPIRKDLEDSFYSFDTTALPDGRYRFRVTASDRASNPEGQALSASEESPIAIVDNTPPALEIDSATLEGSEIVLKVTATDALSPIVKAEGTVNADRWRVLLVEDGSGEALREHLVLRVPKPAGAAVVSVRVLDAGGNSAAIAAEYPKGFR